MRITMNLCIVFCYLLCGRLVSAKLAFKFSKKGTEPSANHTALRSGLRQKSAFNFNKLAYPQPLPEAPRKKVVMSPYTTLYQGLRYEDDTRVFRKRFDYAAMLKGQQVVCKGIVDCVISHIAIESTEATPVLLRGGAGYRHFTAIIRAKPHRDLKGQVRVYCRNQNPKGKEPKKRRPRAPSRRFFFGERLAKEMMKSPLLTQQVFN